MNSDYHDGSDIVIQVVLLPRENPELRGVKQGTFNCVILPVVLLLQKRKASKSNQKRIDDLLKYHEEVKDSGLDNDGILKVSKMSRINIAIYDHCGKVWHKFAPDKKWKTLLLDVHNQHAEVRNDKQLLHSIYLFSNFFHSTVQEPQITHTNSSNNRPPHTNHHSNRQLLHNKPRF